MQLIWAFRWNMLRKLHERNVHHQRSGRESGKRHKSQYDHVWTRTAIYYFFFSRQVLFFLGSWFYAFLFLWVSAFLLFCFSAFLLLCFSASVLFCFYDFLLLCFPASLLFLLLCFSASLLFAFPASLLFLLLCFSAFCFSLLLCFSASLFSLLLCFCISVPFYFYYSTFSFLQSCVFAAPLPAPLLLCVLSLLSLCFSFFFALFCSVCIPNETLERP